MTFKKQILLIWHFYVVYLEYGSHTDVIKAVFIFNSVWQIYIIIQAMVLPVRQQMRPDALEVKAQDLYD